MEQLLIVGLLVWASDLCASGRLGSLKGLIPAKTWTWAQIFGLIPRHKAAMGSPGVVEHRGRRAKRGYYYVNTSR